MPGQERDVQTTPKTATMGYIPLGVETYWTTGGTGRTGSDAWCWENGTNARLTAKEVNCTCGNLCMT